MKYLIIIILVISLYIYIINNYYIKKVCYVDIEKICVKTLIKQDGKRN